MGLLMQNDRRAKTSIIFKNINRRQHNRLPCNRAAELMVNGKRIARCVIKDISAGGAKLLISASDWMPATFQLFEPDTEAYFTVRRVWNKRDVMGVEFCAANEMHIAQD